MSRSYCKALKYREDNESWIDKSFRARNRQCINLEMRNPDYGDVVFPIYREYFEKWGYGCKSPAYKKEIRDKFFLEIRNILNGYTNRNGEAEDESFLRIYLRIKGLLPADGRKYQYEWLNARQLRKVIKNWPGEPLETLKYLTDHGFIEKAVQINIKRSTKK